MAIEVIMPKVAMGQTEGQVVEWHVWTGNWVEKGELLLTIETEKVAQECESIGSGYLVPACEIGKIYPCGTVIGYLAETKEEVAELKEKAKQTEPEPVTAPEAESAEETPDAPPPTPTSPAPAATATAPAAVSLTPSGKIKISPVAKRKAEAHSLDYSRITGSGPGGRIIMRDVNEALEKGISYAAPAPTWSGEVYEGLRVKATVPMQGMRKAIADSVSRSHQEVAELNIAAEVDMTETIRLRKKLLQKEEEIGARITYNDIFLLAIAKATKQVPIINSSLIGNEIKIWEDINISNMVALDVSEYVSGLIAPVIKNADQISLTKISQLSRALALKAKENKLTGDDLAGGTITLSNVGAYAPGWITTTPIINQPQAFIVQPGGIIEKPVALNGEVIIRPMMTVSVTFDHRIMDGVPPLKWLGIFKELLENPEFLHL
jgi:pyruvate dehydrogenase E2 component (dihydrolipoamide acetyltransferase)